MHNAAVMLTNNLLFTTTISSVCDFTEPDGRIDIMLRR
jgi:hypothetical protein